MALSGPWTLFTEAQSASQQDYLLLATNRTSTMQDEMQDAATNRTSTMQDELNEAGLDGFEFVGVTVSSTLFGGDEVVAILKRAVPSN